MSTENPPREVNSKKLTEEGTDMNGNTFTIERSESMHTEDNGDVLKRLPDETRKEYFARVKDRLRAEIVRYQVTVKKTDTTERLLEASKEKLRAVEALEKRPAETLAREERHRAVIAADDAARESHQLKQETIERISSIETYEKGQLLDERERIIQESNEALEILDQQIKAIDERMDNLKGGKPKPDLDSMLNAREASRLKGTLSLNKDSYSVFMNSKRDTDKLNNTNSFSQVDKKSAESPNINDQEKSNTIQESNAAISNTDSVESDLGEPAEVSAQSNVPVLSEKHESNDKPTQTNNYLAIPKSRLEHLGSLKGDEPNQLRITYQGETTKAAKEVLEVGKNKVDVAQEAYFTKLKEYQKNRGFGSVVGENFKAHDYNQDPELVALRREWIAKRSELATSYSQYVALRRPDGLKSKRFTPEQIAERIASRDVLIGREEAEQNARIEGLSERDKTFLSSAYKWYTALPPGKRIVGTSAILMGASAGGVALLTSIAAGGAVGLSVSAASAVLGGTNAAVRWFAEVQQGKKPEDARLRERIAKWASVGSLFGYFARLGVEKFHDKKGTIANAQKFIEQKKNFGDLGDAAVLERLIQSRKDALTAKERIERQKRVAGIAGSLASGIGIGAVANSLLHHDANDAVPNHSPNASGGNTPGEHAAEAPVATAKPPVPEGAAASGAPEHTGAATLEKPIAVAPPTPEKIPELSFKIEGNRDTANELFGKMRDQLHAQYPDPTQAPASVQALFAQGENNDQLTVALGFQGSKGLSAMMHDGDTVMLKDGALVFQKAGSDAAPITLITAEGTVQKIDIATMNPFIPQSASDSVEVPKAGIQTSEITTGVTSSPQLNTVSEANGSSIGQAVEGLRSNITESANSSSDFSFLGSGSNTTREYAEIPRNLSVNTPKGDDSDFSFLGQGMQSQSAAETTANNFGIAVDTAKVHAYSWKIPGTSDTIPIAYGGTMMEASAQAREFVSTNPSTSMAYVAEQVNPLSATVTRYLVAWTSDAQGTITQTTNVVPSGVSPALPDPKDFTGIIK